jgi:hypothetical protein
MVRPNLDHPPERNRLDAPPEVRPILYRACYDCHSNQTQWPWYSRIAPVSWIVAHHVREGRDHLNFSEWGDYLSDPETAIQKLDEIKKLVRNDAMPPWYYRITHPPARLDANDRQALIAWTEKERARVAATAR